MASVEMGCLLIGVERVPAPYPDACRGNGGGMVRRRAHWGMAVMTTEHAARTEVRRRPWLALVLAVFCCVPYAGLVVPYYAAGLQDRPPGQTLYLYELSGLWPYDTALGGVIAFIALFGVPLAPFVATVVAMWSGFSIWDAWRTMPRSAIALYTAAAVVAVASIAWLATPLANDLLVWFFD